MTNADYFAHPTAIVESPVTIGRATKIWFFSHVMPNAVIGERCNIGQNVYVGVGVRIGSNVKIQNNVSVYEGVELEDNVFCGPSCVFTNVTNPRSEIVRKGAGFFAKTLVKRGASIGANATIVCGATLGRYAFVAAGAVVPAREIPDYAFLVGVPARQRGWVSRHGHRLKPDGEGIMRCPESGWRYKEVEPGVVRCLDWDEETPLPKGG